MHERAPGSDLASAAFSEPSTFVRAEFQTIYKGLDNWTGSGHIAVGFSAEKARLDDREEADGRRRRLLWGSVSGGRRLDGRDGMLRQEGLCPAYAPLLGRVPSMGGIRAFRPSERCGISAAGPRSRIDEKSER